MAFAQQGTKWGTGGNAIGTGDRFGTTNPFAILFVTNNIQRMSLSTTGILQLNSLSGTGTGFVSLDVNGNFVRTNFPNDSNKVLTGNGTFKNVSSYAGWAHNGNNLYNTNSGFVGIGTNTPQFILDVNGDARVNGTIYAQGIVLATKMLADTMKSTAVVQSALMRADTMTSLSMVAGTIKSAGMISINNNLNFRGGTANEIYTFNGDVRLQSFPGYNGNTILNSGTNGNVGVGIAAPQYKFDVNGDARVNGKMHVYRIVPLPGDSEIHFGDSTIVFNTAVNQITTHLLPNQSTLIGGITLGWGYGAYAYGDKSLVLGTQLKTSLNANNSIVLGSGLAPSHQHPYLLENNIPNSLMVGFNSTIPTLFVGPSLGAGTSGGVCIGDTYIPDGYKLAVNGKIIAEEVQVKWRNNWPDTVFSSTYSLMPITDLANYVNREHHLPGVPSAQQVQQKQSFGVGEMEVTLLQKVEELTLYMIELQKQNEMILQKNAEMQKEIEELKKSK